MGEAMEPLISLVIPVYNVERYLDKCMSSVLAQTYPNFEVLLIDDGSTDRCGVMCDGYAAADSRVRVFHKPNGGLSDARNYGVIRAHGELVSFVDSDDYITEDYLQYLYGLMTKYDADVSCAEPIMLSEGTDADLQKSDDSISVTDAEGAIKKICHGFMGAWARLYKRELLLNNPYPVGRVNEDVYCTCRILGGCESVCFSTKVIYIWIQRSGSITHSEVCEKTFDLLWASDKQLEYVKNNYPGAALAAEAQCTYAALKLVTQVILSPSRDSRKYYKRIRSYLALHISAALRDRETPLTSKISSCIAVCGYWPTRFVWPARERIKMLFKSSGSICK